MMNLNKKLNQMNKRRGSPKRIFKIVGRILVILIILIAVIFFPARSAYLSYKLVLNHGKAVASAYQNQNLGQIQQEVAGIKDALRNADASLNFLIWLRIIPGVGGYYSDIKNLTYAGAEEMEAIDTLLKELKQHEKELMFLGQPLTGQDRITQAIKVLDKSLPYFEKIEGNFKRAKEAVESVGVDKYPEEFRGQKVRDVIGMTKNYIVGTYFAVVENRQALEAVPEALGVPTSKNYLILFQNDKEIRPTGGFLTAYAFLQLDNGQISTTGSDDIYRLDERLLATCLTKICPLTPPAPIVKYLPEVSGEVRSAWSMRDSNISPDVPTSARDFERIYQLLGQGLPFDGIIYIDTQAVEEIIEVLGSVEVFGSTFSADNDPRCSCPKVIFELEAYAEIAAKGEQDRKAILGVLMQQILIRMVDADTEKLPQLLELLVKLANHKHIMFYIHNEKTQQALSNLNWTGKIKQFDGDYLHINDANFAGGKTNLYVDQIVTQDIKVEKGKVVKKITIEYKNPQPFNTWLNGINRDYVRFYMPKGSKLISSNGSDDSVNTLEELDKTVFDAFITVRPQNSRTLEIEYEVPYTPKDDYKLLIQKQPGAKDFHYIIKLNGRKIEDFKLNSDKEFKFDI